MASPSWCILCAVKQKEVELLKETETPAAPAENAEAKSEPDENKKEE